MPLAGGRKPTLNFALVGGVRGGTGILQPVLHDWPRICCHRDLFHVNPDKPEDHQVRRDCHESYFGPRPDEPLPEYWVAELTSPARYLSEQIFDTPRRGEKAIGVRLLYSQVTSLDLYDFFEDRCAEGDFCLIHVLRNPVACFVSWKQALASKVWTCDLNDDLKDYSPRAVRADVAELTAFVREHDAAARRIERCCRDRHVVHFNDLVRNPECTLRKLAKFLELPDAIPLHLRTRRLRNMPMKHRIAALALLRQKLPKEVRDYCDAEDFI